MCRLGALLVVAVLAVPACTGEAIPPTRSTPPTTRSTTTTTIQATTSTTVGLSIDGAPAELTDLVETYYDYVTGRADVIPSAPEAVLAAASRMEARTPETGVASVGSFQGQGVATVEMEGDLFLAVEDESGWRVVGGNWPSVSVPSYYGPVPRLVAVIGSDARPGEDVTRTRADSIHLVGLDGAGSGAVVGIPRDSWVSVPGVGNRKITGSLAIGGPDALMDTLRELTGTPIEGYVLTGFVGFQEMLGNVLGGINLYVPLSIRDSASGADLVEGDQYLNGPNALALARARKTLAGGDFTRSEHQGLMLIGSAKTVRQRGYGAIPRLMEMSEQWFFTDLTAEQLLTFSALVVGSDLESMPNIVAPGSVGWVGGASVVFLSGSVEELWVDLADGRLDD